jgi:hypothetical protein
VLFFPHSHIPYRRGPPKEQKQESTKKWEERSSRASMIDRSPRRTPILSPSIPVPLLLRRAKSYTTRAAITEKEREQGKKKKKKKKKVEARGAFDWYVRRWLAGSRHRSIDR